MSPFTKRFLLGLAAAGLLGSVSVGLAARDPLAEEWPAARFLAVPAAIPPADADILTVVPVQLIEAPRPEAAVALDWSGPPVVRLHKPNDYTLTVRNVSSQPVQKVTVQVRASRGATVAAGEPAVTNAEGVLLWELPALDVKQSRDFKLTVTPTARGETGCQAWVTFTGTAGMKLRVQEPTIAVTLTAPERVALGGAVPLKITVKNTGDCPVGRMFVTYSAGKPEVAVGSIDPGEEQIVTLQVAATAGGVMPHSVTVTAPDCDPSTATAQTLVTVPKLAVTLTGPKELLVNRPGRYTYRVENVGDAVVKGVAVRRPVPAGWRVSAKADWGTKLFAESLAPGQSREETFEATPLSVGVGAWRVEAVGEPEVRAAAECRTAVDGVAALRMELVDLVDPVERGQETTYEVRVTNTGTKADAGLVVTCPLPEELKFVRASGPTGHATTELNRCTVVRFDPVRELAPNTEVVYRVVVKAVGAGDVRFKAQLNARGLSTSVVKEESTRVYGE